MSLDDDGSYMGEMADYHFDVNDLINADFEQLALRQHEIDGYPHGRRFTRRTLRTVINSTDRLPGTWVTAEGVVIRIADMKNSHLRNTIEMLRRESLKRIARVVQRGFNAAEVIDAAEVLHVEELEELLHDLDERARLAWGDVYLELVEEGCFRSDDGDLEKWLTL